MWHTTQVAKKLQGKHSKECFGIMIIDAGQVAGFSRQLVALQELKDGTQVEGVGCGLAILLWLAYGVDWILQRLPLSHRIRITVDAVAQQVLSSIVFIGFVVALYDIGHLAVYKVKAVGGNVNLVLAPAWGRPVRTTDLHRWPSPETSTVGCRYVHLRTEKINVWEGDHSKHFNRVWMVKT